ncbi:hypothetical protein [Streptomyces antimycoticus]|uniref:hypothetical protein n=1 Tax=Streptomyces antimycoticus TaxID=68175 RepID=UPI00099EF909
MPDASVILLVITVNTVAGVVQEVRAERAVAALTALSAPTARVIRDGVKPSVPAADVVPFGREFVQVGALVVVQTQNAGQGLQHGLGRLDMSLFEPGACVVRRGDAAVRRYPVGLPSLHEARLASRA